MGLPRTASQRAATAMRKQGGIDGGRSNIVVPPPPPPAAPFTYPQGTPIPWSMNPVDVTDSCPVHRIVEGGPLGVWRVTLEPASGADVSIDAIVDGSVVDSFTLTAGLDEDEWDMSSIQVTVNQRLKIAVTAAGSDGSALTVHPDVF